MRGSKSEKRRWNRIKCKVCLKGIKPGGYGARLVKGRSWCSGCDGNLIPNAVDGTGKRKERERGKRLCKET